MDNKDMKDWEKFIKTGSIVDYLKYREHINYEIASLEEAKPDAHPNRRTGDKRK